MDAKQATKFKDSTGIDHDASVRIEIKVTETTHYSRVLDYLTKTIEKAGWRIDDSASNAIRFVNDRTTRRAIGIDQAEVWYSGDAARANRVDSASASRGWYGAAMDFAVCFRLALLPGALTATSGANEE